MSETFGGVVERSAQQSVPWWPPPNLPDESSPNVVIVLLDDAGFAHFGCYGAPIETPTFDRLAANGLRFTNFTVAAVCSPTRAALLTGRNHHSVGMRFVANFDTGFPNMRGGLPKRAATMARVLRDVGYATFAAGKWHIAPGSECSAAGPFHNWPLAQGFERFYGFMGGETDQFHPELVCDNRPIEPPGRVEDGYHLTEDLVDQSIGMIRDLHSIVPERPFFLYLATGATHAPHQSPEAFRRKYRGHFDEGWDVHRERVFERQKALGVIPADTVLPPRNPGVHPWDELSDNEQQFACRLQEAYAAFMDHTDHEVGRLVDFLDEVGELDNTLFIVLTDNGASQEGGARGVLDEMKFFQDIEEDLDEVVQHLDIVGSPMSHSNYPWGWAMVGNTPFKRYKQNVHWGGVRAPCVVHWPAQIEDRGAVRTQFHNVIDLLPTVLDACGVLAPAEVDGVAQMALHGTSMRYTFASATARSTRSTQYFEMYGHRAIYHDGWKAVTWHETGTGFDDDQWELYDINVDFSESNDLASSHPAKLAELIERWWIEAGRYDVLPLDDRLIHTLSRPASRGLPAGRQRYVYRPPISHLPIEACPPHGPRAFSIAAEVVLAAGDEGVLVNRGTGNGGYALFVQNGRLCFDYNYFHAHTTVVSDVPVPQGRCVLGLSVEPVDNGSGRATLRIDERDVGSVRLPKLSRTLSSLGMDIGRSISPVCDAFSRPFAFTGRIDTVTVEVPDHRPRTPDEITAEIREQLGLS
ncbi:MAG: arylsulfatase [Acidimicrobiales bacterium]